MTPNTIDNSKPLSLEEEKSELMKRKESYTLYCLGDIVRTKNKSGDVIPVRLTKIRNNSLSFTDDIRYANIPISNTKVMIERFISLLKSIDNITTLPALQVMFGVVLMELDYLYVRLNADKQSMNTGLFLVVRDGGDSGDAGDYGKSIDSFYKALDLWDQRSAAKKDDACYFNPGFDYQHFEEQFNTFVDRLHEKGNAVAELLKEIDSFVKRPPLKTIMSMYDLHKQIYMCSAYNKDLDDFETFHIGVTKANTIKLLTDKLRQFEKELDESKVFEKFGYDLETVICKLYTRSKNAWDEESIAKHIFAHRKELSQKQLNVFFKYVEIGGRIKKELEEFKKTPDSIMVKVPSKTDSAVTHQESLSSAITAQELNELLQQYASNRMPLINLTVVNGENRIIQPENYGDNIIMGANSKIERIQSNEHGEPQQ